MTIVTLTHARPNLRAFSKRITCRYQRNLQNQITHSSFSKHWISQCFSIDEQLALVSALQQA